MGTANTVRTARFGKMELRLVEQGSRLFGLANGAVVVEGDRGAEDDLWRRLHDRAGLDDAKYFGFDGARARFLRFFPGAFSSDHYMDKERAYKAAAKTRLDAVLPVEAAVSGVGVGAAALAAFHATDLLSPFEKMRVDDVLKSVRADAFVQAAARFTLEGGKAALAAMDAALEPDGADKWTVATYLPFLWRPDVHLFLKPDSTRDFAERVGHPFPSRYEASLHLSVYDSLLDLARVTMAELAPLHPRDHIDLQTFIWVVGAYKTDQDEPAG